MPEILKPGREVLIALAKALGLEGRRVRRIVLDVSVDNVPKLTVEKFVGETVTSEGFLEAAESLRPFLLVGEVPPATSGGSGGL